MDLLIEKERAKNFLSCEMCNKYTITTTFNGVVYSQAYYGYPKRMAISEFKKYVKNEIKCIA
jgi:DNA primase catalytic subunit